MASQQWMMGVTQALNSLWVSLPLQGAAKGTSDQERHESQRQTMNAFGNALDGYSLAAINNVISALCRGEVEGQNVRWSPTAPELSQYVRSEQKRLDAINRRPAISHQPVETGGYKDWRIIHRQQTKELEQKGYRLVQDSVSIDTFNLLGRRKKWQIGATWFWSLQEVWAPVGAAFPSTGNISQEVSA